MQSQQDEALADHCWARRCALVYQVRLSILYHLMRERFFDQVDKFVSIVTALSATSAVASMLADSGGIGEFATAATACLSLIPLVFNPASSAKRHGQLATDFRKLRADFERKGEHWDSATCDEMSARLVELESSEPAHLYALVAFCQNQLNVFSDGPTTKLTWAQRHLMHIVRFDASILAKQ